MRKKGNSLIRWWNQYLIILLFVIPINCIGDLGIWNVIVIGAYALVAGLAGIATERAYMKLIMERLISVDDPEVKMRLLNHQFKIHLSDGSLSDWTDRVTAVEIKEEPVTINGDYNFNGQRIANVFISIRGTRNSFSYRMDEIVLVSSGATPSV